MGVSSSLAGCARPVKPEDGSISSSSAAAVPDPDALSISSCESRRRLRQQEHHHHQRYYSGNPASIFENPEFHLADIPQQLTRLRSCPGSPPRSLDSSDISVGNNNPDPPTVALGVSSSASLLAKGYKNLNERLVKLKSVICAKGQYDQELLVEGSNNNHTEVAYCYEEARKEGEDNSRGLGITLGRAKGENSEEEEEVEAEEEKLGDDKEGGSDEEGIADEVGLPDNH